MSSPFITEVLRETLDFLEGEFPLLSDPPQTTKEAAVAVLCCRVRYALHFQAADAPDEPFGPESDTDGPADSEDEYDGDGEPHGDEDEPDSWQLYSWDEPSDAPDMDASGRCFSDADPGL